MAEERAHALLMNMQLKRMCLLVRKVRMWLSRSCGMVAKHVIVVVGVFVVLAVVVDMIFLMIVGWVLFVGLSAVVLCCVVVALFGLGWNMIVVVLVWGGFSI